MLTVNNTNWLHCFYLKSVTITIDNNNAIVNVLIRSNLKRRKSNIKRALWITNIDIALREEKPPKPINESIAIEELYAKWKGLIGFT